MRHSRKSIAAFVAALVAAVPAIAFAGSTTLPGTPAGAAPNRSLFHGYVDGEILVKFRSEYTAPAHADTVKRLGGKTMRVLSSRGGALHHIKTRAGVDVQQALDEFSLQSAVEFAQPNYVYHASAVPNDLPVARSTTWASNVQFELL